MFTRPSASGFLPADEDLDREFDEVYGGIVAGRGVRTDEEELALVNELVRRAEQGAYPEAGAMHIISPRVDIDWASDEAMLAVRPQAPRNNTLIAGGVLIVAAILFALLSMFGGRPGQGGQANIGSPGDRSGSAPATSATGTSSLTGTISLDATHTAVAQATAVWAGSGIVVGTDYKQRLPPLYPETLEIDGVPFRVYPSSMEGGKWGYQDVRGTVSWIGGTMINWSFGLPALDDNIALFKSLGESKAGAEGTGWVDRGSGTGGANGANGTGGANGANGTGGSDNPNGDSTEAAKEALLRMSGGVVRHFRLQPPQQIERQQIEVFMQNQPGLTIVLLGDEQGPQRWLLRGVEDYEADGYGSGVVSGTTPEPTASTASTAPTPPVSPAPSATPPR